MRVRYFRKSGITLLEVMIALGAMAFATVAILGSVVAMRDLGAMADGRQIAVAHLSTVLEDIRHLPYDDLLKYRPPSLPGLSANETMRIECIDDKGTAIALPMDPVAAAKPLPNPLQVRVTITRKAGRDHPVTVSSTVLCGR